MIAVRSIKRGILAIVVASALTVLAGAPPAFAQSPWWHLTSAFAPASLSPGHAQDEVQEITISPNAAFELKVNGNEVGYFESAPEYPYGFFTHATAANVQAALESVYGAGNVEVTEGPAGSAPLLVTSVNADADRAVGKLEVSPLIPETGEAKVVTEGRADGTIIVVASNLGDADVNGSTTPVTVTDTLPTTLKAVAIEGVAGLNLYSGNRGPVKCVQPAGPCTFKGILPPYEHIEVRISVNVEPNAESGELNRVSVSGGETGQCSEVAAGTGKFRDGFCTEASSPPLHTGNFEERPISGAAVAGASISRTITVSGEPTPFGAEDYELMAEEEGGAPTTQAGSHPFQLTTTLMLNREFDVAKPVAMAKDLSFKLPPGLIGNPAPFPQCTDRQFVPRSGFVNECPASTAVGVAAVTIYEPVNFNGYGTMLVPLFNLEPLAGEPARFGFQAATASVYLDASVRTGQDYGVTVSVDNITQLATFLASQVTFWGVPGNRSHDNARGWSCIADGFWETAAEEAGQPACARTPLGGSSTPPPFLTLPTSCTGPLQSSVEGDSWQQPGNFTEPFPTSEPMQSLDGCNKLRFEPEISVSPDVPDASTPTGLEVKVHVPQDAALNSEGLGESNVRDTTVTLPEGMTLNPGGADGLEACSETQIGYLPGGSSPPEDLHFTPKLPEPLEPGRNFCPDASKIGTVSIKSPLLPNPLEGAVYLAAQGANPFGSLIAMYLVAEDPVSGVLVKLAGEVSLDPSTGRVTTTFKKTPQLPFEDLKLHFFGGSRAPLSTPPLCGGYTTNASFTPWSGNEPVASSSTFKITTGPNGSPCPAQLPFAPSLTAGTTSIQAGGFSPFTMTMSREDGNQNLQAISLHMPPGLSGLLSGVELCPEPQADQGTCGPNSLIGETIVSVGVGGNPYTVKGGRVYITGPYNGQGACTVGSPGCAPFGLSIVNPAKAGPFDLGQVIVRAKIEIDPLTSALTVTSDNTGPYKIPTILKGIPLQIQHVNVTINRPAFTFNPTSCDPMKIGGSLTSDQGASAALSVPFQATNCATLGFKPAFSVSTSGKTSRANGASLHVKLVYPKAPFGSQANIRSVKVNLPKQLPSRLTTLQKACPDTTFNSNPAACPSASRIGTAHAITPLVPVPLAGPAYFVSHGGAKFPELVIVLSGYGVTVQLRSETFINKAGITSSTFRTVPDVPVGTFELTLPEGKYSALAANGNLCTSKLAMPTAFTAQNGMVIHQSTVIAVTGCKPAVRVLRSSVKGATATIVARVPSAGRLSASGTGLSGASKKLSKAGTATLTLTLSKQDRLVLSQHPGRRLKVSVNLLFTPKHGKRLTSSVTVLMG